MAGRTGMLAPLQLLVTEFSDGIGRFSQSAASARYFTQMVGTALALLLGLVPHSGIAAAQQTPRAPSESDIYCSGMITTDAVPRDTYLISGEQSDQNVTFTQGDYVYINKGSRRGAQVGEEFLVVRPVRDTTKLPWFAAQDVWLRVMGTRWKDLGRLRVVVVQPDVSIAQVAGSCDFMLRGDTVLPFAARPAPPLKSEEKFDRFAPASGRRVGLVVAAKDFRQEVGQGEVIYVNLGVKRGVKPGDYVRIFRYQDGERETLYRTAGMAINLYGFGRSPKKYRPEELPREILGEGIVLRVSPWASTVLLTYSLREIFTGAYVELE